MSLMVFYSRAAQAQEPAASCSCNRQAGTLVIRYTPDLNEAKPPWPKKPTPVLFMSLLDLDEAQTTVQSTRSKTIYCRLKSDRFEITLEPGVPNVNLLGRCGAAVTGIVTVKRNGRIAMGSQEFEDLNCHERQRMLEKITFRDGATKPELTYTRYSEE